METSTLISQTIFMPLESYQNTRSTPKNLKWCLKLKKKDASIFHHNPIRGNLHLSNNTFIKSENLMKNSSVRRILLTHNYNRFFTYLTDFFKTLSFSIDRFFYIFNIISSKMVSCKLKDDVNHMANKLLHNTSRVNKAF
ncbi:transposase-like protein [Streptococcus equi subsp. zooepidemicus SzAM60]|nr:transposase-like protein [Streptococcus equi subsp. zooepidemicus SzAM60]